MLLFWPLPPGFTYSHLSIGTATDTVWGQQTEWGGEWGWRRLLCVCFLPCLLDCKGGGGLRITGHGLLSLAVMNPAPHASPEQTPPLLGLISVLTCLLTYCTCATFGLCVLENPVGEILHRVLQSCLQSSNIWCIYSCNSPFAATELTLVFKMHHVNLEKEAQHFKLITPQ